MRFALIAFALSLSTAGCAVYPVTRSYYAPDARDGTPAVTDACSYFRTSKDALEREVTDVRITVTPNGGRSERFWVSVQFTTDASFSINATEILVHDTATGVRHRPSNHWLTAGPPMPDSASRNIWVGLHYDIPAASLEEFAVEFPPTGLRIKGAETALAPFRFRKVTTQDIRYLSINC